MKQIVLVYLLFLISVLSTQAQLGQLDVSFGENGLVTGQWYSRVAVQPDGKIVAAGERLVRFNPDGSPDESFSSVEVGIRLDVVQILFQPDRKIIIAGRLTGQYGSSKIVRYNNDGTLDKSFVDEGVQTLLSNVVAISLQTGNKIIVAGEGNLVRLNGDGSFDNSFAVNVFQDTHFFIHAMSTQTDGKIVVAGSVVASGGPLPSSHDFAVARYLANGGLDVSFGGTGVVTTNFSEDGKFETLHGDDQVVAIGINIYGKIAVGGTSVGGTAQSSQLQSGFAFAMYGNDGSAESQARYFFGGVNETGPVNAKALFFDAYGEPVIYGDVGESFAVADIATSNIFKFPVMGNNDVYVSSFAAADNSGNTFYAVGGVYNYFTDEGYGVLSKHILSGNAPAVKLSISYNIYEYTAPGRIKLEAALSNFTSSIKKVRFYNGTEQIHTEVEYPYGFLWTDVPEGEYTLTAKAYDELNNVVTSNSVTVSVRKENAPPVVTLNDNFSPDTYNRRIVATAKDPNGRIANVKFYDGAVLIRTENYYPYAFTWHDIPVGSHTITAVATDDEGLSMTSASHIITVQASNPLTTKSNRSINEKNLNSLTLSLSPNPANQILNISVNQDYNGPAEIYLYSGSGALMRKIKFLGNLQTVDISSLAKGNYFIKVMQKGNVSYKQFLKL